VGTSWRSIDRRLPLLIAGVLLTAVAAFAWAAYGRVQHVLLANAGPRLQSASLEIDVLLSQFVVGTDARLDRVASDPAVVGFLRTGRGAPAARAALAKAWVGDGNARGRVSLHRPDGTIVLDTATGPYPTGSDRISRMIRNAPSSATTARMGPLIAIGDSDYYESVAPIQAGQGAGAKSAGTNGPGADANRSVLGFVSDLRLVTGSNVQIVRDLIGTHAVMALGSPATGVWSDLERPVPAPRGDVTLQHPQFLTRADGTRGVGVATRVSGAPWVLWVEQPVADVLAPVQPLLAEIAGLAALVILAGALGGWILSRRITRPIVLLTAAAEGIATGPGEARGVGDGNNDEVTRLADAFQRMAGRVRESLATATAARAEAEAQTREARALADELEQQVEEAQALSEELEQSNERLQLSVSEADAARAEAEAANGAKVEFLATMSHELRTPLNAIAGYVDLLDAEVAGSVSEEQAKYLARIKRAQGLLLRRIDDMLNFAKIDSGTLTYAVTTVAVEATLSPLVTLMQPLMAERGLALKYIAPAPQLAVRADGEKCEQIVLNLLSNAMKFTKRGGRVEVACTPEQDRVAISVADTGVGIPPDKLGIVFEPFIQVDPSLTRQRDGTGLGLAISRQLARGMGGELTAVSTPGVGSIFTLTLPLARVESGETPASISASAAVLSQTRATVRAE
jgi:signal transduction histidine kinase